MSSCKIRKIGYYVAWENYLYWQTQGKKTFKCINQHKLDIDRKLNDGIGKPELLTGNLIGFWSRRIDEKNRLVYRITDNCIEIAAVRIMEINKKSYLNGWLKSCNNITKVCVLSDSEIFLEKWDVKFRTNDLVKQSTTHFGSRVNHIQFAENKLKENCLECVPENIIKAPFRVTVHLALLKKDVEGKYKSIQWELDRERWEEIKNRPIPWKIQLKTEFGMLLS